MSWSDEPMKRDFLTRTDSRGLLFWMVVLGALALFAWGIWSVPLLSHNEARRLVVMREMLANHQWLTPMKNGVFYFEKPPLFYWSGVLVSLLTGSTAEWVLRLPSALAALFTTGFLYRRVRYYIGRQPALFSALVLVSSYFYVMSSRRAEINVFFATLCFMALLFYFDHLQREKKRYLYAAFFVLGLAVLTKGPVALIFFLAPLLVYGLVRRDRRVFKGLINPLAWLLFAVVGVSWFVYALYGVPDSPLRAVIHKDLAAKVYENYEAHSTDPFYYYFVLLLGAFPWLLLLFYRPKRWLQRLTSPYGQFLLCAFGVPLLIMSCFAIKHGKYLLPIFPFLAAFLGAVLSDAYDDFSERWGKRFQVRFLWLSGGILAILFAVFVLAPSHLLTYRFSALKPMVEKIRAIPGDHPVYCYRDEQIQLIYYYGKPMPVLDKTQLNEKLAQREPFLLVAEGHQQAALENRKLCLLEEFAPYLKKDRNALLYGSRAVCMKLAMEKAFSQRSVEPDRAPRSAASNTQDR